MKTIRKFVGLYCLAVTAVVVAGPDLSKLPAPSTRKGVTYADDIRPLFEASCFRCHGEKRQKGDLRLDSLEAALKGGENGKVITPGKSGDSSLIIAVAQLEDETAMPPKKGPGGPGGGERPEGARPRARPAAPAQPPPSPGGPGGRGPAPKPLTATEVGLVRAWIDQGAK